MSDAWEDMVFEESARRLTAQQQQAINYLRYGNGPRPPAPVMQSLRDRGIKKSGGDKLTERGERLAAAMDRLVAEQIRSLA